MLKNFQRLSLCKVMLMDGTFSIAPSMYDQVYTIHGFDDSTGWTLPAVYALLPNRTTKTYKKLLNIVVQHAKNWMLSPDLIITDFEIAAINAADIVFPGASICGCHFHFCQASKRQRSSEMTKACENSSEVSHIFKSFYGLAFLPAEYIPIGYSELKNFIPTSYLTLFEDFLEYFLTTWVGTKNRTARFPPNLWSVYHRTLTELPRTNNLVEGWNSKIHGRAGCNHPTFFSFVRLLQKEQDSVDRSMELIVAGEKQLLKRNKYVQLGKRLLNLVKNYPSGGVEILDFLKGVAHNMGNDSNRWKNKRDENEDENNEENKSKRPRVQ